jgi:signal transduction histidine kinase
MTPTDLPWLLLSATILAALAGGAWFAMRCRRWQRACHAAETMCAAARTGEASVTRTLQLFAHELQALALNLRGLADTLSAERHQNAESVAVAAAQLGSLADELCHHLMPAGQTRVLVSEVIDLAPFVQEAVGMVAASISPGRRNWRIRATQSPPVNLWADRRALRLVLLRVLGEAVRTSAQDDWIEIGWRITPDGLVIDVEDEGTGNTLPAAAGAALDSRGIGLRLSLARSLAQAHGGSLEVEALARVGTSVSITLPTDRLRGMAPAA